MNRSASWIAVLPSLVIPVCFGLMLYLGLSYMIDQGHIANESALRYLTGHPVSNVTVGMFFIGIASLALIAFDIAEQFFAERKIKLDAASPVESETPPADVSDSESSALAATEETNVLRRYAVAHGKQLIALPKWMRDHYLWQRLMSALDYLDRTQETSGVDEELKYLADLDLDRQQQRYSLVRILIWATPMLGFLGTVLGISQALGGINVGPDNDFQGMMDGLRGSLYIAFDTTALALTLSMVMMFCQFVVERFETQLLVLVDQRARTEIARQYDLTSANVDRFADQVREITKESLVQQTEVWRKTIHAAEAAWQASLTQANEKVQTNLSDSLEENVYNLSHYLGEAIEKSDAAMSHRWGQWQVTLSQSARVLADYQAQLTEQTLKMLKVLENESDKAVFKPAIEQHKQAIEATAELRKSMTEWSAADVKSSSDKEISDQPVGENPEENTTVKEPAVSENARTISPAKGEQPQVIIRFPAQPKSQKRTRQRLSTKKSAGEIILPFSSRDQKNGVDESGQRLNKAA